MQFKTALLTLLLATGSVGSTQITQQTCDSLRQTPLDPDKTLPSATLTKSEMEVIKKHRACIKTYSLGFPGGEDGYLRASAREVQLDLLHLQKLFARAQQPIPVSLPKSDKIRLVQISKIGWDREQVLLWGNWAYLQRLTKEHDFATVLKEAARIRQEFGLNCVPLDHWDDADEATYFSPQTLRNMIVAFEYLAKGHLTPRDGDARKELVRKYLADERALIPTMTLTGNPGKWVLGPDCEQMGANAGQ